MRPNTPDTIVIKIFFVFLFAALLALGGCGRTTSLKLVGALSYARTFASSPDVLMDKFKARFTDPFVLETIPAKTLLDKIYSGRFEGAVVAEVPFFMQDEFGCGAAALAGVLAYYGMRQETAEITRQVVVPEIGGTICTDMVSYPRTRGLWSEHHFGNAEMLCSHLAKKRPVICLLGTGKTGFGGHYILVTACAPGEGVVCHNGVKADAFMPWREFEALWNACSRWMLVICPPEEVDWQLSGKLKNELGRLLHRRGELEKALHRYRESLDSQETDRRRARVTYNIGLALFGLGRLDEAVESFKEALSEDPELPDAANALAYTYATLGENLEEAAELSKKALDSPGNNEALFLDTLGYVLYRLNRNNEAVKVLRGALEKVSNDTELEAEIYYHLGLACVDDPSARVDAFRKAVSLSPESKSGRRARALLEKNKKNGSPVDGTGIDR